MSAEENKARVRLVYEKAGYQGDLSAIDVLVAPGDIAHYSGGAIGHDTLESVKQWVISIRAAFPDVHVTVRSQITTRASTRWPSRNSVEGYLSELKRSLSGTFHHVSERHLGHYFAEFDFRYNTRKQKTGDRTTAAINRVAGKCLTYRGTKDRKAESLV